MYSLPAFIRKLYSILSNPEQEDVICWTEDGEGVMIKSVERLCNEVLVQNFRHSNYNSFVRQVAPFSKGSGSKDLPCLIFLLCCSINTFDDKREVFELMQMHMYSFKKDISYEHVIVFKNPYFRKNDKGRLSFIKRKPLHGIKKRQLHHTSALLEVEIRPIRAERRAEQLSPEERPGTESPAQQDSCEDSNQGSESCSAVILKAEGKESMIKTLAKGVSL